jgi:thiol-disulfide isomerase/thioredoxin
MPHGATKQSTKPIILMLASVAAIVAFWLIQSSPTSNFTPSHPLPTAIQQLQWHSSPKPIASITFKGRDNQELKLATFVGRPVLLNLWATWCAPCIAEMPALDQLQASFPNDTLAVIALSLDRGGLADIQPFWKDSKISSLKMYFDPTMSASQALGVRGLPTTLLINKEGQELARMEGPAEWADHKVIEYFRKIISSE